MKLAHKGFTLIELLVVVTIIGILSTIVISSLSTAQKKGRDSKRVADIKTIQLALEGFYNDYGYYPADIYASTTVPRLLGAYLQVVPVDTGRSSSCNGSTGGGCYYYVALGTAAGQDCTSSVDYHIGALMDLSNNTNLYQDSDANKSANVCTGSGKRTGGLDFYGSNSCSTSAASSYDNCYDFSY